MGEYGVRSELIAYGADHVTNELLTQLHHLKNKKSYSMDFLAFY
jgi:hypothetical protein